MKIFYRINYKEVRAWNQSMADSGQFKQISLEEFEHFMQIAKKFDVVFIQKFEDED